MCLRRNQDRNGAPLFVSGVSTIPQMTLKCWSGPQKGKCEHFFVVVPNNFTGSANTSGVECKKKLFVRCKSTHRCQGHTSFTAPKNRMMPVWSAGKSSFCKLARWVMNRNATKTLLDYANAHRATSKAVFFGDQTQSSSEPVGLMIKVRVFPLLKILCRLASGFFF